MELELGNSTGRSAELAMTSAGKRQRAFASEIMLSKATTRATSRRVTRTCQHDNCGKNPYFGWHGGKAIYCVAHKEAGMVDVKNKRCEATGCMKRGLFGFDGERARFCGGHRLEGMVDLKNKRCKWVGCAKQATFALEGKSTACFCSEHRSPGMVDVKGRRCETPNCVKQAAYALDGQKPKVCLLHRRQGMVDVKARSLARSVASSGSSGPRTPRSGSIGGGSTGSFGSRSSGEIPSRINPAGRFSVGKFCISSPIRIGGAGAGDSKTGSVAVGVKAGEGESTRGSASLFAAKYGKRSRATPRDAVIHEGGIGGAKSGGGVGSSIDFANGLAGAHLDLLRPAKKHAWFTSGQERGGCGREIGIPEGASLARTWSLGAEQQLGGRAGQSMPSAGMWSHRRADTSPPQWFRTGSSDGGFAGRGPGGSGIVTGVGGRGGGSISSLQYTSSSGFSDLSTVASMSAIATAESVISNSSLYDDGGGSIFDSSTSSMMPALMVRSCSSLPASAFGGGGGSSGGDEELPPTGSRFDGDGCGDDTAADWLDRIGRKPVGGGSDQRLNLAGTATKGESVVSSTGSWPPRSSPNAALVDMWQSPAGILTGVDAYTQGLLSIGGDGGDTVGGIPTGVSHEFCDPRNGGAGRSNTDRVGDESAAAHTPPLLDAGPADSGRGFPPTEVGEKWLRDLMQESVDLPTTACPLPRAAASAAGLQNNLAGGNTSRGATMQQQQQRQGVSGRHLDQVLAMASSPLSSSFSFSQQRRQSENIQNQRPGLHQRDEQMSPDREGGQVRETGGGGFDGLATGALVAPVSTLHGRQKQPGHQPLEDTVLALSDQQQGKHGQKQQQQQQQQQQILCNLSPASTAATSFAGMSSPGGEGSIFAEGLSEQTAEDALASLSSGPPPVRPRHRSLSSYDAIGGLKLGGDSVNPTSGLFNPRGGEHGSAGAAEPENVNSIDRLFMMNLEGADGGGCGSYDIPGSDVDMHMCAAESSRLGGGGRAVSMGGSGRMSL